LVRLEAFAGERVRPPGVDEHDYDAVLREVERLLEQAAAQEDGSKILPQSGVKQVLGFRGTTRVHRFWSAVTHRIKEDKGGRLQVVTAVEGGGGRKVKSLRLLPAVAEGGPGRAGERPAPPAPAGRGGRRAAAPAAAAAAAPAARAPARPTPARPEHGLPRAFLEAVDAAGAEGVAQSELVRALGVPAEWLQHAQAQLGDGLVTKRSEEMEGRKAVKYFSARLGAAEQSEDERKCAALVPDAAERAALRAASTSGTALLRACAALSALRSPDNPDGFLINMDARDAVCEQVGSSAWSNTLERVRNSLVAAGLARTMQVQVEAAGLAARGLAKPQEVLVRLDADVTDALRAKAVERVREATKAAAAEGSQMPGAAGHEPGQAVVQADGLQRVRATTALQAAVRRGAGAAGASGGGAPSVSDLNSAGMIWSHLGRAHLLHAQLCADMARPGADGGGGGAGAGAGGERRDALREAVGRLSVPQVYETLGSAIDLGDEGRLFRDLDAGLQEKVWEAARGRLEKVVGLLGKLGLVGRGGGGAHGGFRASRVGVCLVRAPRAEAGAGARGAASPSVWVEREFDFAGARGACAAYWGALKAAAEAGAPGLPEEVRGKRAFTGWHAGGGAEARAARAERFARRVVHFRLGRLVGAGGGRRARRGRGGRAVPRDGAAGPGRAEPRSPAARRPREPAVQAGRAQL